MCISPQFPSNLPDNDLSHMACFLMASFYVGYISLWVNACTFIAFVADCAMHLPIKNNFAPSNVRRSRIGKILFPSKCEQLSAVDFWSVRKRSQLFGEFLLGMVIGILQFQKNAMRGGCSIILLF